MDNVELLDVLDVWLQDLLGDTVDTIDVVPHYPPAARAEGPETIDVWILPDDDTPGFTLQLIEGGEIDVYFMGRLDSRGNRPGLGEFTIDISDPNALDVAGKKIKAFVEKIRNG